VTYSGLIGFAIGMSSVFTGMVFLLIVTRTLTPNELGTWSLIGGLLTYAVLIEPIVSYWLLRETARGVDSGKTAVISSGILSVGGFCAYLVIAFFVAQNTDADLNTLFFWSFFNSPYVFQSNTVSNCLRMEDTRKQLWCNCIRYC